MKKSKISIAFLSTLIFLFSCNTHKEKKLEHTHKNKISIPFELTEYNNIKIKTTINGRDSLDLKFDSGTTGLLLTHKAIKEKTDLLHSGKEKTPTQNYVKLNALASLEIGELTWNNLEIYPVLHSGQGTDGRFGWDLFKNKIVIIDYDTMEMIIQEELPVITDFTKSKLIETQTVLSLDGQMIIKNKQYKGRFLFDTGYQKTLLLDSILLLEQSFPKNLSVIKTNQLRNGAGEVFVTKVVELPQLVLGEQVVNKIPTQILNQPNPAGFKTHIIGNELLKRFNTVLDLKQGYIYFKKNKLINQKYSDAS